MGYRNVISVRPVRLVEQVLFECARCDSQRQTFLKGLSSALLPESFDVFLHSSAFDKVLFCLREKQGMLAYDECRLWYSRVGDVSLR